MLISVCTTCGSHLKLEVPDVNILKRALNSKVPVKILLLWVSAQHRKSIWKTDEVHRSQQFKCLL